MGKDKAEKKDKREKKEKRSEKDGVHKSSSKKDKKDKKDKTALAGAVEQELTSKVIDGIDQAAATEKPNGEAEGEQMEVDARPAGAVVPFANPLVEDKSAKKVLKSVKKG